MGNPAEGNMNGVVFGSGRSDESDEVEGVVGGGSSIRLIVGRRRRCSTGKLWFGFDGDEESSSTDEGSPAGAIWSTVSGGMARESDVS